MACLQIYPEQKLAGNLSYITEPCKSGFSREEQRTELQFGIKKIVCMLAQYMNEHRRQILSNVTARAEMLINKPAKDVFDAFVNPGTIKKFWLKSASGPLTKNATVEWTFMVQGAHETVTVTEFIPDKVIAFNWSDGISVEMKFEPFRTTGTRLSVTASGFKGTDAPSLAVNATEGFTIVMCDLKSLLETGQSGHMVRDKATLISADRTGA